MIKIFITLLMLPISWVALVTHAEAPLQEEAYKELKTEWTTDEVKELVNIYADKYGVSRATLQSVVNCESSYNYRAVNMQDSHATGRGSFGTAQFAKSTFESFSQKMNKEYDDVFNPEQSLDVMAWAFSKGYANHWSCFKKVNY